MSGVCTTDSDVIFVSARCPRRGQEIICDQTRRRALQRDVDLQSQPEQPARTNQRSVAVERPAERMKMKVEGERSEEKLVKKEKKLKKGLASVSEDNNCTVDDESQAGVKKEKKKKKGQKVLLEDGGDKREEKKKKKKKEVGSESLNEANTSDFKTEEGVKKEVLDLRKEETEVHVKEKKKKRKKEETTEEETTEDMDGKSVTKKKNKSKTKVGNGVKFEKPEEDDGDVVEVKVKKKKKKDAQIVEDENEVVTSQIKGNKKKSKEEEGKSIKCETAGGEEGETQRKKKGKKEKGGKASVEVSEVEETEPKKKKRKNGSLKEEEDELLSVKCEEDEEQTEETPLRGAKAATKKKAKKKSSVNVETLMESVSLESQGKKKKKKKIKEEVVDQRESPHVDVVFLSEKSGNADEVTINQERRQALQMEIDEASQPEKTAKPPRLGQWSTAQFDSSEQQQKFLRLMGGFKKGFHSATGSPGGANMALGKEAQQQLQQGLLGEFERAHTRRMDFNNRGAGLGFAAPSNKKFSIDINKRRSVCFDD